MRMMGALLGALLGMGGMGGMKKRGAPLGAPLGAAPRRGSSGRPRRGTSSLDANRVRSANVWQLRRMGRRGGVSVKGAIAGEMALRNRRFQWAIGQERGGDQRRCAIGVGVCGQK